MKDKYYEQAAACVIDTVNGIRFIPMEYNEKEGTQDI